MTYSAIHRENNPDRNSACPNPSGWRRVIADNIRALGLAAWLMLLLVPFWWHTDWKARHDSWESAADRPIQVAAFLLAACAQLASGPAPIIRGTERFLLSLPGCLWTVAFVTVLSLSAFSIRPLESAGYSVFTAAAFLIPAIAWEDNADAVRRMLGWTGWLICAFMGVLCLRLGWNEVTIGGMQHNQVATTFFTALVCFQFLSACPRWSGTLLTLAVIGCTSSRSTLLLAGVFLALVLGLRPWTRSAIVCLVAAAGSMVLLLVVDRVILKTDVAWGRLDSLLRLSDVDRGLQSGLTGRTVYWREGLAAFLDKPIMGYGFRTRWRIVEDVVRSEEVNAHNGYLNLLLDVGILGALPIYAAIISSISTHLRRLASMYQGANQLSRPEFTRNRDFYRIAIGVIGASLVVWLSEPAYLNLGASHTVLLIIMLAAPAEGVRYAHVALGSQGYGSPETGSVPLVPA